MAEYSATYDESPEGEDGLAESETGAAETETASNAG